MRKFLVINGPNLDMLGTREPEKYGNLTLNDICMRVASEAEIMRVDVEFYQSNSEGKLIDRIHASQGVYDGIILNAGAYTHYSYAIRDAISCTSVPCVEVHMTNVAKREEFRHTSVIAPVCVGSIAGFGHMSYILALRALVIKN